MKVKTTLMLVYSQALSNSPPPTGLLYPANIQAVNQTSCLALASKALAPLISQTTKTHVSSPRLDSTKPTYLLLPSPLQRSVQIVQGLNLVLQPMYVPQTP
eukprot:12012597-Ditylum_brightwellii.AAC.1